MRAVNLLPRGEDARRTEGPNLIVLVSVLAAVLLTAILAGGFLMEHSKAAEKQRALDDKKAELAAIPAPPAAQTAADQLLLTDKNQRVVALSAALSHRVAWDRIFRELSQILPSDVWLNQLTANAPVSSAAPRSGGTGPAAPASATTATGFILQGYTYSHDAVARLLSRLALVPDLKDVQLQSSVATIVRGRQIVTFQIGGNISSSGSG